MLTINLIREQRDFVVERLKIKNFDASQITDRIIQLDAERRDIQTRSDNLQAEMNRLSKEIGILMKSGQKAEAEAAKEKTYSLKENIKLLTEKMGPIENELRDEIVKLPNLPHESVSP
ncbi:MAG TPA: hypothetical protein VJ963_08360, partial [Bacteroidales bacterium]|nr:hypothetical protein [Bacteroidales bacterium]